MTLYLFWGIPAKYNLPVENFHPYGVQSSKVKEGCTVFPMQQNLSNIFQRIKNTYQVSNDNVLKTNYLMSLHRPIYKINAVN